MGLEMVFKAADQELVIPLTSTDGALIPILSKYCPDEIPVVFGARGFGEPEQVTRGALVAAIDVILATLERDWERLPYTYFLEHEWAPGVRSRAAEVSGIRLPGDEHYYAIDAGAGSCVLEKRVVDEKGHGHVVETIDIRSRKAVSTENMGVITIKRTKKPTKLRDNLQRLRQFVAGQQAQTILRLLG